VRQRERASSGCCRCPSGGGGGGTWGGSWGKFLRIGDGMTEQLRRNMRKHVKESGVVVESWLVAQQEVVDRGVRGVRSHHLPARLFCIVVATRQHVEVVPAAPMRDEPSDAIELVSARAFPSSIS
jgi:hypothetical protein